MAKQQIVYRVNALFNNQIIVDGEDVKGFNINTLALNLGKASKALKQYPENSPEYQGALSDLATIELEITKAEKMPAAAPAREEPAAAASATPNPAPAPFPDVLLDDFELAILASMQSLELDEKNRQDKYGFGAAAGGYAYGSSAASSSSSHSSPAPYSASSSSAPRHSTSSSSASAAASEEAPKSLQDQLDEVVSEHWSGNCTGTKQFISSFIKTNLEAVVQGALNLSAAINIISQPLIVMWQEKNPGVNIPKMILDLDIKILKDYDGYVEDRDKKRAIEEIVKAYKQGEVEMIPGSSKLAAWCIRKDLQDAAMQTWRENNNQENATKLLQKLKTFEDDIGSHKLKIEGDVNLMNQPWIGEVLGVEYDQGAQYGHSDDVLLQGLRSVGFDDIAGKVALYFDSPH